ncbi:hypothetical protein E3N88_19542 [Mikania micrantha]|uniref:Malectin-like domain-containing protein n=1 Tax=Mikania micrantha TaxID=192012 RepID=A0A5N6NNJ1_9ASTR|nr:hypothetical protein E3N88_19542 [Mikania micrantha]
MALFITFYSVLILQAVLILAMVHAQDDQSGFISIDCGIAEGSTYTDEKTGINYVSDTGFIDSGKNQEVLSAYKSNTLDFQLRTLKSFPENTRNCYTLKPKQGKGNRYLVRARFMYGNYDFKSQTLEFDLYLGNDHWSRVRVGSSAIDYEIIHLTSSNYIYVCLVNIGLGNPFISALELRLLDNTMYADGLRSLNLFSRSNFGASEVVRYADDKYDRIWNPAANLSGLTDVQTSSPVSLGSSTKEKVPSKVMSTAIKTTNTSFDFVSSWKNLSNNNLGSVPKFLASLDSLKILILAGNNFTRPLPAELLEKAKKGLSLSIEDSGPTT